MYPAGVFPTLVSYTGVSNAPTPTVTPRLSYIGLENASTSRGGALPPPGCCTLDHRDRSATTIAATMSTSTTIAIVMMNIGDDGSLPNAALPDASSGDGVGTIDGCVVGNSVGGSVGCMVGDAVGDTVGSAAVGDSVGDAVGADTVGEPVGDGVGIAVGDSVGAEVVGGVEGRRVGVAVGFEVLGNAEGEPEGELVGIGFGERVGAAVRSTQVPSTIKWVVATHPWHMERGSYPRVQFSQRWQLASGVPPLPQLSRQSPCRVNPRIINVE